ncbi:MAG: hypothetical protein NTX73_17995 [Rhodobacterales bacterium]|nr:hypothetical protein [Rhodobacterales bacterium]
MSSEEITWINLGEIETLIVGILALFAGGWLRRSVPFLGRIDMPNAVIGAAIVAVLVLIGEVWFNIAVRFGSQTRDALLLVFFTTIGLSAKLESLRAGGKPLVLLCFATVLVLVAQNAGGAILAALWGVHPAYGVLAGSLSFVGGPGTAMAWASQLEADGLPNAAIVGVGASTLATVSGALVAGPVAGWIIRRHNLRSTAVPMADGAESSGRKLGLAASVDTILLTALIIAVAVLIGERINLFARGTGLVLPGFLSAMLAGVIITNLADVFRYKLDFAPIEKVGAVSLQLFLVVALMSTPLVSVGQIIVPLMARACCGHRDSGFP